MNNIEILKLLEIDVPDMMVWPRDILSMCEIAVELGLEPGMVYWESLLNDKMSFSGLLSKGKPPERRTECILFELDRFRPYYMRIITKPKDKPKSPPNTKAKDADNSGAIYEVVSNRGHWIVNGDEMNKVFPRGNVLSEIMPAIARKKK